MLKSHLILLTILTFFLNNIFIWYQLNGQLVWDTNSGGALKIYLSSINNWQAV